MKCHRLGILRRKMGDPGPCLRWAFNFPGAKSAHTVTATQRGGKPFHASRANTVPPAQSSDSKGPFWLGAEGVCPKGLGPRETAGCLDVTRVMNLTASQGHLSRCSHLTARWKTQLGTWKRTPRSKDEYEVSRGRPERGRTDGSPYGELSWDSAFPDSSPFFPVELP